VSCVRTKNGRFFNCCKRKNRRGSRFGLSDAIWAYNAEEPNLPTASIKTLFMVNMKHGQTNKPKQRIPSKCRGDCTVTTAFPSGCSIHSQLTQLLQLSYPFQRLGIGKATKMFVWRTLLPVGAYRSFLAIHSLREWSQYIKSQGDRSFSRL
jgi:hypothetical protein